MGYAQSFMTISGKASYYGKNFHGKYTASGEIYDMNGLTAAHRTLPLHTIVKVTNIINKKSVTVKINDRGPVYKGFAIDLSKGAATKLDMINRGVVPVLIEIIKFNKNLKGKATKLLSNHYLSVKPISTKTSKTKRSAYYVQLAAFSIYKNAYSYSKTLKLNGNYKNIIKQTLNNGNKLYHVLIEASSEKEAFIKLAELKTKGYQPIIKTL